MTVKELKEILNQMEDTNTILIEKIGKDVLAVDGSTFDIVGHDLYSYEPLTAKQTKTLYLQFE